MKKFLTLVLAAILAVTCCVGLTACNEEDDKIKVGLICLHGESSTYDKNFIDAFNAAVANKGVEKIIKIDIAEGEECYTTAADLVDQGCDLIFADSFGHEDYMIRAAKEFPEVEFCHATGTKAHTENLPNYHNAFANIYEGRFLAGVAAGMKLVEMQNAGTINQAAVNGTTVNIGYVGAWPYAEVKSGYTSFYLGAKYVIKDATLNTSTLTDITMDVKFTNYWYNLAAEGEAANALIPTSALISQHADSMGAPNACEQAGIPNVSYNGSTATACPNTFIISSKINWQPYFEYIIDSVANETAIVNDYCEGFGSTLANGSVALTELGTAAAAGTANAINDIATKLRNKEIRVFDVDTFTVDGAKVTSYEADVDDMGDFVGETEVIKTTNGIKYFAESEFRSAPYFDLDIDGISIIG